MPTSQKIMRKPVVAIVGRPNVGKSALFNSLAGRNISIVHDQPGVTRDHIVAECRRGEFPFEIIDTGGIGEQIDDGFSAAVQAEADVAVAAADLILFVVDVRAGITGVDSTLAAQLRRSGRPIILIINKSDTEKTDPLANEFSSFGFNTSLITSSAHGRGMDDLVQLVTLQLRNLGIAPPRRSKDDPLLDEDEEEQNPGKRQPIKIAIVGRPNVGKSSLVNAILNAERTIVSDVAGTTRDSLDVPYERDGVPYVLIDTAGMRRRSKQDTSVEVFSVIRSEKAVRRADICLLVIDASAGVVHQDHRIAGLILEARKPCIIVLNKFDLYHPTGKFHERVTQFQEELADDLFFIPYAPKIAVSALEREHMGRIFKAIETVRKASQKPVQTSAMNRLLQDAMQATPPPHVSGKRIKLLYATQKREDDAGPIPTPEYLLFVNNEDLMPRTYQKYLENTIRAKYPMVGLPCILTVKSRRAGEPKHAPARTRKKTNNPVNKSPRKKGQRAQKAKTGRKGG